MQLAILSATGLMILFGKVSNMKALCIKCGAFKATPWESCPECKFLPVDEDLVRSVYCSSGRFVSDPERRIAYEHELLKMSADIRSGTPLVLDCHELARLRAEREVIHACNPSVAKILFRISLPAIVMFMAFFVLLLIRYCHR